MDILLSIVFAVAGAVFALGTYIFVRKILLKGQKEEIIKKAELEAESIKKEKIFQAKEKFLQLKSEHEQYINEKNKHPPRGKAKKASPSGEAVRGAD